MRCLICNNGGEEQTSLLCSPDCREKYNENRSLRNKYGKRGVCKRCHVKAIYTLMCGYCPDCFIEREGELKVILLDSLKHPAYGNSERIKAEIEEQALFNRIKAQICIVHGYAYPCPVCDGESDS